MGRGILTVSYSCLEQVLHLPEGHKVVGLRQGDNFTESFEIAVEGPQLPEKAENAVAPRVQYQITVTEAEELVRKRTFVGKFEEMR